MSLMTLSCKKQNVSIETDQTNTKVNESNTNESGSMAGKILVNA